MNSQYQPKHRPGLEVLKPYLLPFTAGPRRHKLDVIENLFPVAKEVAREIARDVAPNVYPTAGEAHQRLTRLLAEFTGAPEDHLLTTNGSDNALQLIVDTFVTPTSRVLVPVPSYPHFMNFLAISGCEVVSPVVRTADELPETAVGFDLVYIVSPNILHGYTIGLGAIERLCQGNTVVVIDEAYIAFSSAVSAASLTRRLPNLIVVQTFSKAFALAGLRLGYLVTGPVNMKLLRVSHNPKNVTDVAMRAGACSLERIDYYRNVWQRFEKEKRFLHKELTILVSEDGPITGYCVGNGNFFTLQCNDSAAVARAFADNGIDVRDKHEDCPFTIRISIGTRDVNEDVIKVCSQINIKSLVRLFKCAIDLDGTLRADAKMSSPVVCSGLQPLLDGNVIVTNNPITREAVVEYFKANDLVVELEDVYTSLMAAKRYITAGNYNPLVIASPSITSFLEVDQTNRHGCFKRRDIVVITDNFYVNLEKIVDISEAIDDGASIIITDDSRSCTLAGCSELESTSEVIMPDLGSFAKIFESVGATIINVGKPSLHIIDGLDSTFIAFVIGDSESDRLFAEKIECEFILVKKEGGGGYDFDRDCYTINSIADLL